MAALAHAPTGDAIEHDVGRHLEIDREIERRTRQHPIELARLVQRARETVEHEPAAERTARRGALFDHADHDLVGNELARVHVALGLETERRALGGLRAEHVAGRHMRDAIVLGQAHALRSLAGALLPEQHESGLRVSLR